MLDKRKAMLDMLTELAMIVGSADFVDWGELPIKEEDAYRLMASHVLELLEKYHPDDQKVTLMAVSTHLMVENFVLHVHLEQLRHRIFSNSN